MSADELDAMTEAQLSAMLMSAISRKRWEAKLLAAELLGMAGQAMAQSGGGTGAGAGVQYMEADQMMAKYGIKPG